MHHGSQIIMLKTTGYIAGYIFKNFFISFFFYHKHVKFFRIDNLPR